MDPSVQEFNGSSSSEDMNCTVVLSEKTAITIVSLLVPSNNTYWKERTESWYAFFYLMVIIYSVMFLSFAITCLLLLCKRHLAQRFKVRTFIAIDLALAVLGVSRFVFLLLDPWGQSEFCTHYACIVLSRLLGALGFPSLTASYTLVFITLWISAHIQLGRSWIQKLKILIPLCCMHYVVAIIFEVVLLVPIEQSVVVLALLIACEALFSLWGFLVCFMFFVAGFRLLKTLKKTDRKSSMICRDSPNMTRADLIERSKFQKSNEESLRQRSLTTMKLKQKVLSQQKRALRKVTLITYVTVVLGMLYSILSITNLCLVIFGLFDGCPGEISGGVMYPEVWLLFRYVFFTIEFCMAVLLTYSINDITPIIEAMKKAVITCCESRLLRLSPEVQDSPMRTTTETIMSADKETAFAVRNALSSSVSSASGCPSLSSSQEENDMVAAKVSPLVVSFSMNNDVFACDSKELSTSLPHQPQSNA